MKVKHTLTIMADSRPGLLHLITGILEKKLIGIVSLSLQPPAADGSSLITTEIMIEEVRVKNLVLKLNNIVEVFWVKVTNSSA